MSISLESRHSSDDPSVFASSASIDSETDKKIVPMSGPSFFNTSYWKTTKKVIAVAAIITAMAAVAAIACSPIGAGVISMAVMGYVLSGIGGGMFLASIIAMGVLFNKSRFVEKGIDLTQEFKDDPRTEADIIKLFAQETGQRGTGAEQADVRVFIINHKKIDDEPFVNGDSQYGGDGSVATAYIRSRLKMLIQEITKHEKNDYRAQMLLRRLMQAALVDICVPIQERIKKTFPECALRPIQDQANTLQYEFTISKDTIKACVTYRFNVIDRDNADQLGIVTMKQDILLDKENGNHKATGQYCIQWD